MNDLEVITSIKNILKSVKNDKKKLEVLYQFKKLIIEGRAGMYDNMEKYLTPFGIEFDEKYINKIGETAGNAMEWIDTEIKNLETKLTMKDSNVDSSKTGRRFKRKELKKNCKEIAIEIGLVKEEELTQSKIDKVCALLERKGFVVNNKSVGTVLREKLGYKKKIY